jgi:hypothetical protein
MQLKQLEEERKRSYLAVAHLDDGPAPGPAGREVIPEVETADWRRCPPCPGCLRPGLSSMESSWDYPRLQDGWLIDVETGRGPGDRREGSGPAAYFARGGHLSWWDRDPNLDGNSRDRSASPDRPGTGHRPGRWQDHTNDRPVCRRTLRLLAAGWLNDDSGFFDSRPP